MNKIFLFFCASVFCTQSIAESSDSFGKKVLNDIASPVTTKAKWVLIYGAGATLAFDFLESNLLEGAQVKIAGDKPLGKWNSLGDWGGRLQPNIFYFGGMLLYSWLGKSEKALDRSILMLKSTVYAATWSTLLKVSIREPRPDSPDERTSFPSGHTTTAFAFASVIGAEHEWYWGLGAYTLATLTAISRVNDNRHFIHDVVAGATIGASYGLGLYYKSHPDSATANASSYESSTVITLLPNEELSGPVFNISASF